MTVSVKRKSKRSALRAMSTHIGRALRPKKKEEAVHDVRKGAEKLKETQVLQSTFPKLTYSAFLCRFYGFWGLNSRVNMASYIVQKICSCYLFDSDAYIPSREQ